MPGFIAVHCGAGEHKAKNYLSYKKLSRKACIAGMRALRNNEDALMAIKCAVKELEDNPITNAGFGSNLTLKGTVETDAAIMDGCTLLYGGCGAVKNVKNPIDLAYDICVKQRTNLPLGLIPPSLLVGSGALEHAKSIGLTIVGNKQLITPKTMRQYRKYKALLDMHSGDLLRSNRLDTVGAVCMDPSGKVAAASSSGGIILKRPGRVGQAALYASGIWADSYDENQASIAVSTTGCGEHLMKTLLAKEIAVDLQRSAFPVTDLHSCMNEKFLKSKHLASVGLKMGGALVLHQSKGGEGSVLWAHSTRTMVVGYMGCNDKMPKCLMSQLPKEYSAGTRVTVGGSNFFV